MSYTASGVTMAAYGEDDPRYAQPGQMIHRGPHESQADFTARYHQIITRAQQPSPPTIEEQDEKAFEELEVLFNLCWLHIETTSNRESTARTILAACDARHYLRKRIKELEDRL